MGVWKGAWFLAKHELAKDRWKSLFTLLMIGYVLLFTLPLFRDVINGESEGLSSFATDFIYLTILPVFGFVMNQTMMRYWKDNSYTKKMAQWRTLPISSRQIALGRIIQLTIVLFAAQLVFFLLQYIMARNLGSEISAGSFALYALTWFGYSLTMAIGYVYWEVGHSGRTYFFFNIIYLCAMLLIALGISLMKMGNIVMNSLQAIEGGSWWFPLLTLSISAAAFWIGVNRIESRLENRTYSA
ncbi:hypothetical protein [Paenibacillus luteus]|uniref:hypothetical protein n=1 Tax=Paenibacillus luteus TaxID=2545753 RepID=UPI0011420F19|nr:hypothetical protein [Paenibacillus luteus]